MVGQLCSAEGRLPEPKKVEAISKWKECTNQTEVHGFLGACLFFWIWIKDMATIAEPLFRLLWKDTKFHWGEEQKETMGRFCYIWDYSSIRSYCPNRTSLSIFPSIPSNPLL